MPFTATLEPDFASALETWEPMAEQGDSLPFQRRAWLMPWRETVGRRSTLELLPITIRDGSGVPVAGLPLVAERNGRRRIGFADGGLADYNAPILGPAAPRDLVGATSLWRALLRVLPTADAIRFERMPRRIGERDNPFALLAGARPSPSVGLSLVLDKGYEGWLANRPRRYRMELGRCARLFDALPGARFERVGAKDGSRALGDLEALQRNRFVAMDKPYALDDPDSHAFHHALAADRDASALFALRVEGRVVAALFGLRIGTAFVMLRVAADADLSRLSPARLVITKAMERLGGDGVRTIDFGLGDYDYKRRLGGETVELVDLVAARSLRGFPDLVDHYGRAALRAHPRARAATRWMRGALRLPRFRPTRSP